MKYKRLLAEMFVKNTTKKDLAVLLELTEEEIIAKLEGDSDFFLKEVLLIMNTYFKTQTIDYIFST